jgi:hypothetical protein
LSNLRVRKTLKKSAVGRFRKVKGAAEVIFDKKVGILSSGRGERRERI